MSELVRCPDCGHPNPSGSSECSVCHYPLTESIGTAPAAPSPAASPAVTLHRPIRPRSPRPDSNVALSLWLGVGAFLGLLLVVIALQAVRQREQPPVEGSNADQQKAADMLRAVLEKDSTNVQARVGLGDILFDTGNWPEAIVQYRSAVRQDSSLIPAMVDMGVCYYNLSDSNQAERLFLLALARDPHQAFALYNLGIVCEHDNRFEAALKYFHRALESAPSEKMKQALIEAMQRVAKQTGKTAAPL